jgi:hypothetical protein
MKSLLFLLFGFALGVLAGWLLLPRLATRSAAELPARRVEATVFLPIKDNQDRPFPESVWQQAVEVIVAEFGGATLGQVQEGCWRDDQQRLRREPIRPLIVSFPAEQLETFRTKVREVGRKLGQESMYVRYEEPRIDLLPVKTGETTGGAKWQPGP